MLFLNEGSDDEHNLKFWSYTNLKSKYQKIKYTFYRVIGKWLDGLKSLLQMVYEPSLLTDTSNAFHMNDYLLICKLF